MELILIFVRNGVGVPQDMLPYVSGSSEEILWYLKGVLDLLLCTMTPFTCTAGLWPVDLAEIIRVQFYFQIPISTLYLSLFQLFYQIDSHKEQGLWCKQALVI